MEYKVVLNVYDLSPSNKYLYSIGLGFYHSGVEVNGKEYSFGGNPEMMSTGVFEHDPLSLEQEYYRCSIEIGTLSSLSNFYKVLSDIKSDFPANEYHVVNNNCNHFANEFCMRLVGTGIPGYINRMAKLGSICSCLVPKSMTERDPVTNSSSTSSKSTGPSFQYNNVRGSSSSSKMPESKAFSGKGKRLCDYSE